MTPCLRALKARWPHLGLTVLTENPFHEVFTGSACIDDVAVLERGSNSIATAWKRFRMGWRLRQQGFDLALNYHGGPTSRFLMRLAGVPRRVGYDWYFGRRAYTDLVANPAPHFGGGPIHTVQLQLGMLTALGLELPDPLPDPEIHIPAEAIRSVAARLEGWGIAAGAYIHVHPTAALPTKQWPPAAFAALIRRLGEAFPQRVVLTAGPGEGAILDAVEAAHGSPLPRATDLTIKELAALADGAAAFIGCDSGPAHVAAARKTRVCVVFGSSDAAAWHPWGTEYRLVRRSFPCQPCPGFECRAFGSPRCILEIPPEDVFTAFCDLMR